MGLFRDLMIEGIVTDMAMVTNMATETDMAVTDGVVIDREMTNMVMAVTDGVMVVRGSGVTRISRLGANSMVVLMGHQARGDSQIMSYLLCNNRDLSSGNPSLECEHSKRLD
ncbi:hypothetical protein Tco_0129654 [Tanacetum coccineum]